MMGKQNRKAELWFNHAPERVAPPAASNRKRADTDSSHMGDDAPTHAANRPAGTVYHFLLPDPGMAAYGDKAAKALEPRCFERIADWRKRFFKPFEDDEIAELAALSDRVDALWALHAEQLAHDHRKTEDALPVWGRRAPANERHTTNTWKDRIRNQGVFSQDTRTASPYRRLKLVMDYWCALWFWPIREAGELPDRHDFLNDVSLVLTGSVYQPDVGPGQTADLFGAEYADHAEDIANRITDEVGMLDLDKLFEQRPRLRFVDDLAQRHRFHHWELAFADLFYGWRADGSIPRRLRPGAGEPAVDPRGVEGRGGARRLQPAAAAQEAVGDGDRGATARDVRAQAWRCGGGGIVAAGGGGTRGRGSGFRAEP